MELVITAADRYYIYLIFFLFLLVLPLKPKSKEPLSDHAYGHENRLVDSKGKKEIRVNKRN